MRLSFSTLACPDWSLVQAIDAAGRHGYDGLELRFLEGDDALWARPELLGAGLVETRARLADAGLAISCVDTRAFFHHLDENAQRRAIDESRRCLELAASLGAPGIRVFGDRIQPGEQRDATRRRIADALNVLAEHARSSGVGIWLESHGDFARAEDAAGVLGLAPAPEVGLIWDPSNAFEADEQPAEGWRAQRDRVRHVHLKDVRPLSEPGREGRVFLPVLPGAGTFGPERVLRLLFDGGYAGFVSFEWEKKWYPAIEPPEVALPAFSRFAAQALRGLARPPLERPAPAPPAPRQTTRGRLAVEVHRDRPSLGAAAAADVASHLKALVARDGRAAAIFASAPSQNEFLAALRADSSVPWPRVEAFHLDEFVGVRADHPASFRRFLRERLFDHVPVAAFHGLAGEAQDPAAECARYARLLRQARPGLAVLGIGENGHVAFIDPPECDFFEPLAVRVVHLDEACRRQQVNDGNFASLEQVPREALSLAIPFLLSVPRAAAVVPGPAKTAAVAAAMEGPVTRACPASVLRRHPDATLYLDPASALGLAG
jgi:glucosamine-6-phosphate deaminase